ncbi:hypothetical protein [Bdellovibrio sp.]|uniref:hypothetical protein n=1 Tax=Bdellovibrio sp. TaxID=28201 RepID=UPI0039E660D4
MNKISGKTHKTVVKIFINTLTGAILSTSLSLGISQHAWAESETVLRLEGEEAKRAHEEEQRNRRDRERRELCRNAENDYKQAETKIAESCRKAGLGADCVSKAKSCAATSGEDSFDSVSVFATALGLPAGSTAGISSACPQQGGRDYFQDKDKIQKEIKDVEQDLADLNDDKAKIQDDYNKQVQDIQESLTKAQEDYKKKELEIGEKERQRIAEFNNSQNQAKEEIRKRSAEVLKLRGQLIQSQRDKALKLIAMTDASGKRACMKAVSEAKKSYDSVSSGTSANHIAQAKQKKTELINIYNDCMSAFDQQRVALNESKRQEQEEINQQINDAQSNMDEIQNSLNLASTQLEEMKQASQKEKSDALQSVIDLGTRSQQQMQAAYNKMQENLKTLAAKSASLQAALNRSNQSLMSLGPAPKRGSEYSPADASSEISAQVNILESISSNPDLSACPQLKGVVEKKVKAYNGKTSGRR